MERQQKAYKGVIDYFKKKIMDGELRPGEKLPSDLFTAGIRKLHYM